MQDLQAFISEPWFQYVLFSMIYLGSGLGIGCIFAERIGKDIIDRIGLTTACVFLWPAALVSYGVYRLAKYIINELSL